MKTIKSLEVDSNTLMIRFEDDTGINLSDDAQSCCEHRYMTCDDSLDYYVGAEYYDWETRDGGGDGGGDYSEHDIEFLIVNTSRGSFTVANHNVHNGYYGGFGVTEHTVN